MCGRENIRVRQRQRDSVCVRENIKSQTETVCVREKIRTERDNVRETVSERVTVGEREKSGSLQA